MTAKRAIAIIDLLGIKVLTQNLSLGELKNMYESFIALADTYLNLPRINPRLSLFPNHVAGSALCERHILSDSIVLVAHSEDIEDTLKVIVSAWRILQACMAIKRPVRGAISYDEVISIPQRNFLIGKGLVQAHELEGTQDWMGMVAHESLVQELQKSCPNILPILFFEYDVPHKNGHHKQWALNWRWNFVSENGTKALFAGNPCTDKVTNTLSFARAVVASGKIYGTDPEKWPDELQCFFIGGMRPPFDHGDDH
jgi:hypothetical protein